MYDSPVVSAIDPAVWEEFVRRGKALVREKHRLQLALGNLVLEALGPRSEDDADLRLLAHQIGITPARLASYARLAATP
ncbi:hypothetical protein J5Y04_30970 [Kitasatospora sp. RG8]|uniref:hypothetical protein n=1 Tax=Kitasatospora sp. RG8 TaxID=2820815 RepID=UPI001AE026E9|nr:hypothetical protein [Kitasatospora sp. RG8]MBP0453931.1 hypothetical protein [Kitasatospora sp. RG8]